MPAREAGYVASICKFSGKIRSAFAVDTGSKIVVVDAACAVDIQVLRAGDDQFASATKTFGVVEGLPKSDADREDVSS